MLRERIPVGMATVIWDPTLRRATVAHAESKIVEAVRHGRIIFAVPIAELIDQTRDSFRTELGAAQPGTDVIDGQRSPRKQHERNRKGTA